MDSLQARMDLDLSRELSRTDRGVHDVLGANILHLIQCAAHDPGHGGRLLRDGGSHRRGDLPGSEEDHQDER